jgi:hypothetical protein
VQCKGQRDKHARMGEKPALSLNRGGQMGNQTWMLGRCWSDARCRMDATHFQLLKKDASAPIGSR